MISGTLLLRMRNVSDKSLEKIKTHILCSIRVFFNPAFNEIMWKNIVEPERPQMMIWRMHLTVDTEGDSHRACRAHAVPLQCRAAKGLESVFPIWFTQCGRV